MTWEEEWKEHNKDFIARNGGTAAAPVVPRKPPGGMHGMVLEAARTLPQPFHEAALIVAAWQMFPSMFGLWGCWLKYPDARKIYITLCGKRGLIKRGFIKKVGSRYAVTDRGQDATAGQSPP